MRTSGLPLRQVVSTPAVPSTLCANDNIFSEIFRSSFRSGPVTSTCIGASTPPIPLGCNTWILAAGILARSWWTSFIKSLIFFPRSLLSTRISRIWATCTPSLLFPNMPSIFPIVARVPRTSGIWRTIFSIWPTFLRVSERFVPGGISKVIVASARSASVISSDPICFAIRKLPKKQIAAMRITTQRQPSALLTNEPYTFSKTPYIPSQTEDKYLKGPFDPVTISTFLHSLLANIGVTVNDTSKETIVAKTTETPNW